MIRIDEDQIELTLDDFEISKLLGEGTFGKVYLGGMKETGEMFAIKAI